MKHRIPFLLTLAGALLLAAASIPARAGGDAAAPLFSSDPPSPEALAFLREAYLPALAANDIPQAIALTDLRGFRQYLLDTRMREMKAKLPGMTPEQEKELSAFYQTNNLAPANLAAIVGESLVEGRYSGFKWGSITFAPAPEPLQGHAVQVDATAPDGRHQVVLLGMAGHFELWSLAEKPLQSTTEPAGYEDWVRKAMEIGF